MIIIRPSLTPQIITIIPRYDVTNLILNLLNEETQVSYSYEVENLTYSNGYLTIRFDFPCFEGESFNLEIIKGGDVLYRDKVFATDTVDLENYKLSNGSIL